MGRRLLLVAMVVGAGVASFLVATTQGARQTAPRLIAIGSYMTRDDNEDSRLVVLNPRTFRPVPGEQLRLGDAVLTELPDPDAQLVAIGGYRGRVTLVDPANLRIEAKIKVARMSPLGYPGVVLVGSSTSGRVLGYSAPFSAHSSTPARIFLIDSQRRRLVESIPLHGSVVSATATSQGAAFLVSPIRTVGPTRLVLMDAQGRVRTLRLQKIRAGYVDPGMAGGSVERSPALVSLGGAVDVIGAFEPIASVQLGSGRLSYHAVPGLLRRRVQGSTDLVQGSAGALARLDRTASNLGAGRVLVTGNETYPVRHGTYLRNFSRTPQIVDLRSWRVVRTLENRRSVEAVGAILTARAANGDLVALSKSGKVLFRRPGGHDREWFVSANHLFEAGPLMQRAVELNIRTGSVVRTLTHLSPDLWPLELFRWPLRSGTAAGPLTASY